jgi:hypothetical protein
VKTVKCTVMDCKVCTLTVIVCNPVVSPIPVYSNYHKNFTVLKQVVRIVTTRL